MSWYTRNKHRIEKLKLQAAERGAWVELFRRLPTDGVRQAFPDTTSCQARLIEVRWPSGVVCVACHGRGLGYVASRTVYQCRQCRKQFSLTAGTIMHRSRLDLRLWFIAAEDIITAYANGDANILLIGHDLAARYGISYAAAHRLKATLIKDLRQVGGGFIGSCVCISPKQRDPEVSPEAGL